MVDSNDELAYVLIMGSCEYVKEWQIVYPYGNDAQENIFYFFFYVTWIFKTGRQELIYANNPGSSKPV